MTSFTITYVDNIMFSRDINYKEDNMNQKVRKFMSIFLIFAMIIGVFPANIKTVDAEAIKPTTENKITTFSYQGKDETKTVNLEVR